MHVKVRVEAGAKRETVKRVSDARFEISVREPKSENMANKRIREIIAVEFKVSVGKVRIVSGHHASAKIININLGS